MENEEPFLEKAGEAVGYLRSYLEKRIELFRLELTELVVQVMTGLITSFLILSVVSMVIIFGSLAVALFLSSAIGSPGLAFLIVAGFYLLIAVLLVIFRRKWIVQPILQLIIDIIRDDEIE